MPREKNSTESSISQTGAELKVTNREDRSFKVSYIASTGDFAGLERIH